MPFAINDTFSLRRLSEMDTEVFMVVCDGIIQLEKVIKKCSQWITRGYTFDYRGGEGVFRY